MPKYTYHRDYTLATPVGHVLDFKKGVPVHVPPVAEKYVLAIGAIPEDAPVEEEVKLKEDPQGDARSEAIRSAFELLVARNTREDFTAVGVPTLSAVADLTGFKVDKNEIKTLWAEFSAK